MAGNRRDPLPCVVANVYDAFARGGKLDTITVQRAALDPKALLRFEHGLAYHLESARGGERREILLDFSATEGTRLNNYGHAALGQCRHACGKQARPPERAPMPG